MARQAGFTLVEVLVWTVLSAVVLGAAYSVYRMQAREFKVQENRLEAQEYAQAVIELMVREIRNAGSLPAGACTTTPANTKGIVTADIQTFRLVYDSNADTDCADADENITYAFDNTDCPTGYGNIKRNGEPLTDCNVPEGSANFSFTYYPKDCTVSFSPPVGSGTEACQAGNAGTLAAIRRVEIKLTVKSKNPDPVFGGQLTTTMTSNADLRNSGLAS